MAKKKRRSEAEEYHVEVITKARVTEDGTWEYYVKWAGYDSSADSWEPAENVAQCKRLLKSFWAHVGMDNEDYPPGYEAEADPEWIIKERTYFAREYVQQRREAKKQRELEETQQRHDRSRKKARNRDDSPRSEKIISPSSSNVKGKKKKKFIESESDEDLDPTTTGILPFKRKTPPLDSSSGPEPHASQPPHKISKIDSYSVIGTATTHTQKDKQKKAPESHPSEQHSLPGSPSSLFSASSSPELPLASNLPSTSATEDALPRPSVSKSVDRKRKSISRVQLLPTKIHTGGSTLSTKQRITQGILPTEYPKPNASLNSTSKNLANLSFKKSNPPSSNDLASNPKESIPSQDQLLLSSNVSNAQIDPPLLADPLPDVIALSPSPIAISNRDTSPFTPFTSVPDIPPVLQASTIPSTSRPADDMTEVDTFLKSIMPPELAAPLTETTERPLNRRVLPPIKPALPRISKKWKWTGELFIDIDQDKSERLCEIILTDVTDYLLEGLRLHILLASSDSIRFGKLYDLSDLEIILSACKPSEQVARLGPQGEEDAPALGCLASYLESRQQFTITPLTLDDSFIAILLIFSFASEDLCRRFKVPKHLQQSGSLAATVIPWAISAEQQKKEWRKPHYENTSPSDILNSTSDRRNHILRKNPNYCRALFALQFPKFLHDHMSQPKRPYCVWNSGSDVHLNVPYLETSWLSAILTHCQAQNVGLKSDTRVVFVHVGAITTLRNLPALAERRSKFPELQFFTYGTHESVPPERWGIREIYPLGGVATFTPSAIIEDPLGICNLITMFAKHPLWDCYLLPSVIGMVSKLTCKGQDPQLVLEKGEFAYDAILNLVEQGVVSLLQSPPLNHCSLEGEKPVFHWIGRQWKFLPLQMGGLLEECMKEFNGHFLSVPDCEWHSVIGKEIAKDLACMQMQPVLMDSFRRFVVIKSSRDTHISWNLGGFEWYTLSQFTFKDVDTCSTKPKLNDSKTLE